MLQHLQNSYLPSNRFLSLRLPQFPLLVNLNGHFYVGWLVGSHSHRSIGSLSDYLSNCIVLPELSSKIGGLLVLEELVYSVLVHFLVGGESVEQSVGGVVHLQKFN